MSQDTDTINISQDELSALKARADMLGVTYHPSIGLEKLREKVNAAINGTTPPVTPAQPVEPEVETEGQRRKRMKLDALALIRIRITNMNPAKKEWEGEIITAGNSIVGSVKKYIPFNADEGWHVPRIIYEQLVQRQCQVFFTERAKNGINVRKGKLIKEFAIEVLPQLTADELKELAVRQAAAHSIDA